MKVRMRVRGGPRRENEDEDAILSSNNRQWQRDQMTKIIVTSLSILLFVVDSVLSVISIS